MVRVLIVDDNAMFRKEASRLCEAEGYEPVTAGSWEELNTVLQGTAPDIVLMDVDLPSIPGHRLGALVRARHPVPIALISALPEEKLRRLFESSDADAWISKPLTRDKLVGVVTRLATTAADASPRAEPPACGRRILVVEDDPLLLARIQQTLGTRSEIVPAVDGEEAIEHLWSGVFDAIVLDLMLPRLSGFDVIRHLMMHRPELLRTTIVMTAAQDSSLQFIDQSVVHAILRKPFDFQELPRLVDSIERK
ncbi:MAG TPA: response regulator [Thermoanaerobaculia bacterium]|nr:response regulator [Thermoanaerobaculia bacterium]